MRTLRAAGVEVWFDQTELRGGDAWDQKIRRQIKDCALFVPVISANTASRHEGYFRQDGVAIDFIGITPAWVKPMKNLMNTIWTPIQAKGVNYFTFAAPGNLFRSFSERSNPRSPYYQAWVGGYVTKRTDGSVPSDLPMWASQVTALDQRSWLSAMGDPMPVADFGAAAPAEILRSMVAICSFGTAPCRVTAI